MNLRGRVNNTMVLVSFMIFQACTAFASFARFHYLSGTMSENPLAAWTFWQSIFSISILFSGFLVYSNRERVLNLQSPTKVGSQRRYYVVAILGLLASIYISFNPLGDSYYQICLAMVGVFGFLIVVQITNAWAVGVEQGRNHFVKLNNFGSLASFVGIIITYSITQSHIWFDFNEYLQVLIQLIISIAVLVTPSLICSMMLIGNVSRVTSKTMPISKRIYESASLFPPVIFGIINLSLLSIFSGPIDVIQYGAHARILTVLVIVQSAFAVKILNLFRISRLHGNSPNIGNFVKYFILANIPFYFVGILTYKGFLPFWSNNKLSPDFSILIGVIWLSVMMNIWVFIYAYYVENGSIRLSFGRNVIHFVLPLYLVLTIFLAYRYSTSGVFFSNAIIFVVAIIALRRINQKEKE